MRRFRPGSPLCRAGSPLFRRGAASFPPREPLFRRAADRIGGVDLGRIAWLATVLACLIAVLILALQGYYGYAGVTLAVAISAAINLG